VIELEKYRITVIKNKYVVINNETGEHVFTTDRLEDARSQWLAYETGEKHF
jgi:hypothetical protein